MPSKQKFSKNRKLKSKMKGGNPGPGVEEASSIAQPAKWAV